MLSTLGSSIRHHGQLRSAPRTPLLSTMGSSDQHRSAPWSAPAQRRPCPGPLGAPRCGEQPGALPGGCLRSTVGADPTPSDEEDDQAPKGWAGSRPHPALQEMRCSDCHWSFGACLFRLNAGKETWIRKYSTACDFITGMERSIRVCVCSGGKEVHSLYWCVFFFLLAPLEVKAGEA